MHTAKDNAAVRFPGLELGRNLVAIKKARGGGGKANQIRLAGADALSSLCRVFNRMRAQAVEHLNPVSPLLEIGGHGEQANGGHAVGHGTDVFFARHPVGASRVDKSNVHGFLEEGKGFEQGVGYTLFGQYFFEHFQVGHAS